MVGCADLAAEVRSGDTVRGRRPRPSTPMRRQVNRPGCGLVARLGHTARVQRYGAGEAGGSGAAAW